MFNENFNFFIAYCTAITLTNCIIVTTAFVAAYITFATLMRPTTTARLLSREDLYCFLSELAIITTF